ncbi:MAG: hypothetical protein Alpg2KO_31270 [Alphaproteobacteria bacterium]
MTTKDAKKSDTGTEPKASTADEKPTADKVSTPAKGAAGVKAKPSTRKKETPAPEKPDFNCLSAGTIVVHWDPDEEDWSEGVIEMAKRTKGGSLTYRIVYPKQPEWDPVDIPSKWVLVAPDVT